jgi:hypothetical protein
MKQHIENIFKIRGFIREGWDTSYVRNHCFPENIYCIDMFILQKVDTKAGIYKEAILPAKTYFGKKALRLLYSVMTRKRSVA